MSTNGNENEQTASLLKQDGRNSPALVDKFVIRLPQGLRDQIRELSENNRRSMNSEIIMVLEQHIQQYSAGEDFAESYTPAGENANPPLTDRELSEKLESLPTEKKAALLSLLT